MTEETQETKLKKFNVPTGLNVVIGQPPPAWGLNPATAFKDALLQQRFTVDLNLPDDHDVYLRIKALNSKREQQFQLFRKQLSEVQIVNWSGSHTETEWISFQRFTGNCVYRLVGGSDTKDDRDAKGTCSLYRTPGNSGIEFSFGFDDLEGAGQFDDKEVTLILRPYSGTWSKEPQAFAQITNPKEKAGHAEVISIL